MVLPALIGVAIGAQVVGGLMQYYQAEKTRGANEKRLKEIEAIFNKVVPPNLDISIFDDPRVAEQIPLPDLDLSAITPKDYKSVGQYVPEMSEYIQETQPELVRATEAAKTGRESQMAALQKYRDIASGGFDPMLAQKLGEASDKARGDAQSRQESILQDAARRGMLGSGFMVAKQMNQGADAMRRQAQESQMAAAEAYRNQLNALDRSASLGGDVRQSEMSEQGRNADILNSFNQRTSRAYQDWLTQRANLANQAQMRNMTNQQDISNRNISGQNQAALSNRDRWNQGQQQQFQNKRTQRGDLLDIAGQKRNVQQQQYTNAMNQANAASGVQRDWMQHNTQTAQDRNQATRGVADAVSSGAMYGAKYWQPGQQPAPVPPEDDMGGQEQGGNQWKYRPDQMRW